jgi:predicted glycoside hydrolase/deacetylase ChbG (UPF0249 family)
MKTIFLLLLFSLLFNFSWAQQSAPKLIVRGDDMGSSQASNVASLISAIDGIETSIEVMVVAPWFPEAARLLREHPGVDVGVHLTLTSEWDNIKWRPLTNCPGLTDKNGYFLPMMGANKNYPGLAITENKWDLKEIEQEFRAQIELAIKNIPHVSHLSGHMGSSGFDPKVAELTRRMAKEYRLADISTNPKGDYGIYGIGYVGNHQTSAEKESSFIAMLNKLEAGKTYSFVDHPGLDNAEMRAVHHIGYEGVASDRQGVTDLFTNQKVKALIKEKGIQLVGFNNVTKALPRSTPEKEGVDPKGISSYFEAVKKSGQDDKAAHNTDKTTLVPLSFVVGSRVWLGKQ